MSSLDLNAYFLRIGYEGAREASFAVLEKIHRRQVRAITYENLDVLLNQPIKIDIASIQEKLISRKRGGYCFELNRLLWLVLEEIGFCVKPLAARVFYRVPEGVVRPRTHMVLKVQVDEEVYLVDAGFGGFSLPQPLQLRVGIEQETSHGIYRIEQYQEELSVEVRVGAEWQLLYRITLCEHLIQDFELPNWYLSTHPNSHFREKVMLARVADKGRYAMLGSQWSYYPIDGTPEKKEIKKAEDFFDVLKQDFLLEFEDPKEREELKKMIIL